MKGWNLLKYLSRPVRRRPIRKSQLALEELEARVTPSTDVVSYHPTIPTNSPASTVGAGVDSTETVLTPANVNSTTFGKLFSTTVDGQVYAQPLYMENVAIPGQGTHNVVFVATEHDSLYAIDSTTGAVLWHDVLLTAAHGGTTSSVPSSAVGSSDISPEIGITATPVIDPNNNTIFVEAKEQEVASDGTHYEHYLYAINIGSGAITNKVLIADSIGDTVVSGPEVNGTGAGSSGGVVKFDALRQLDRPGLTLINGNIYLSYASHGDNGPYHGWILGYSESSLAPTAVFNVNPNGSDDGIWQSGGTLAYETVNGNTYLYFETGNGTFDTTLTQSPFNPNLMIPQGGDYGDSFVKVEIDGTTAASGSLEATNNINGWGMHVVDYFTPSNEGNLSGGDTDLGSGAPILLPASAGSAAHPNLMVGSGKEGRIYLIDRDNMGGYHGDAAGDGNSGFDNVVQETVTGAINGSLDTPSFYNGVLYYVGGYGDEARTFTIANGVMSSSSTTQSTDSYPFPGSTPTISDNNGTNAIVWDIAGPGTNQLRAYNAANGYSTEIYTSAQAANSRDSLGSAVKFTVPTVADGEVFVGTTNSLVAYGLLQQATAPPAAPSNLSATAFSGSVINLSWKDNDTAPNTASAYNILESTGGAFTQVGTASAGATSFAVGGLQINTTYSFEVSATNAKGTSAVSNVATATTTSQASTLDFSSGFASSAGVLTYNGSAKLNGTSAELTDGGGTEAGSVFSTNAVDVTKFSTQFTFQLTSAQADGFTFTIQGDGPTALGATGGGLGFQGLNNSVAVKFDIYNNNGEGTDSTGLFTDGAAPFTPATDLSGTGMQLNSGDVFKVVMGYDGTTLNVTITDTNTNVSASQSYTVNIPQVIGNNTGYVGFTGGTGGLTAVQNILTWAYSPTASTVPAAPSNLTGTVISGNEVDISWTDNSNNETGFLIDRSTDGGKTFQQIASVGANVTSYHDTSLSPGETVSYEVQSTNAAGSSAFSNVFTATVAIPPAPPSNLHVTNVTTTEVDLAWTNVATNATGIKILDAQGTNTARVVASGLSPTTSSYNITGLTPGTQYTFEVDSLNSSGPSGAATLNADTLPGQVTGATATAGPAQVTVAWTADLGAVTYNVYRSTTSGSFASTPNWSGITGTSYIDNTATPGTTYYYEVSAVDPAAASPTDTTGESAKSAQVSATAQAASGGISFSGGFAGETALTLNGGATISGSNLELTDGGGTEARSAFDNTAQSIGTFSTQFTFQITGGSNPTADGFTFTIQGNGPTALGPSGGGLGYGPDNTGGAAGIPNSVAIKFDLYSNQGEGVDSTGLYTDGVAPTNVGSLDMTGSVDLHSGDVMQVNLTYDGSNLTETVKDTVTGGTFTHTYTGVNIAGTIGTGTGFVGFTGGTGGLTAVQNIQTWTFTPGSTSTLGAPSNLTGAIQNGPQVQLTWTDNSTSETGFTIQRATDAAFTQNVTTFSVGPNVTTYTDTSTVASTTYYYRVQAVQGTTTSAFSNPVTEAIPAPPATPSNGHPTFISSTEIDLAWTNNASNADVIKIFREVVGGSFTQIASLAPTATSYQDTGLTPGTNYDYHIEAWNVSGNADRTGADVFTVSPPITNLAATASTGQVGLSWSAPAGSTIMTYNVYRGTTAGGEGATAIATGLTTTSFTDTSVTAGTTYYYEVTSVDPDSFAPPPPATDVAPFGESGKSNEASATVPAATGFSAHINFTGDFSSGPGASTTPLTVPGYINDVGLAFGSNGGGLMFGWSADNTANGRDRMASNAPNELEDSLIHMQTPSNPSQTFTWSIDVPNGTYSVHVVTGDPSNTDVVSKLLVNGVLTVSGSTTSSNLWLSGTSTITVTNGVITLSEQAGAYDKVDYIDITSTGQTATAPSITTQPASQTVTAGQSATFSVVASGTAPLSYQWKLNGSAISGATASSYTISSAQAANAGSYTVVVSNSAGSATSNAATLTVNPAALPAPWTDADLGSPGLAGSATYSNGTFTVNGGGADIWNTSDQFNYVYQAVTGNETIIARVASQQNTDPWAKAGVMVRDSLNANGSYAFVHTTPGNGTDFQFRTSDGASAQWNGQVSATAPEWVKLVINGTTITGYTSPDGTTWTQIGTTTLPLGTTYYVGLADTAHNNGLLSTDTFDNVSVANNNAPAINFASGFPNTTGLTLNGTAKNVNNGLQLTDTTTSNEAGSAFSSAAVTVSQFSTSFNFQSDNNPNSADGFTFTIQGNGSTALGPSGGGLGYGPDTPGGTPGIAKSIAVKFDLYNNAGEGVDSTGLFTNGQSPTTGGIAPSTGVNDLTSTGINLHDGDVFNAALSYDGTTLTVKITDTVTHATATQTYIVNIPGLVGGNTAYVGFTGGTGGLLATQTILNWTFTPL